MFDNFTIIHATTVDIIALSEIGRQTFFETFSESNTEENMKLYLEQRFSDEKLGSELNNPDSAFYFIKDAGRIIGYLKINMGNAQTELNSDYALEIERIYVLKEFHGRKAGQLLYDKAIQIAKEKNVDYIWLGVWEENPRAIKFYQKNGFIAYDKHIFTLGDDAQTDIMMRLMMK